MSTSGTKDEDRGPAIIALFWAESAVAILVLALRFYGRLISSKLGKDDWAMLITVIFFLILSGFTTFLAKNGGFRHLSTLSTSEKITAVKYNFVTQPWGISGLVVGKLSVALQLLRIIGPNNKRTRWTLYALMISLVTISVVDCIITFAQCSPPRALWDPSVPHTCWDSNAQIDYAIFVGSWNVLADLVLAALPISIILRMNMTLEQRISTAVLLGLGVVAAVFGIVKATLLKTVTARADITWETFPLYVWTSLEYSMIIICGSIPPIRPVFMRIFFGQKKAGFDGYYDVSANHSRDQKKPLGHFRSIDTFGHETDSEGLRSTVTTADEQEMRNCASPVDRIVRMTDIRIESEPAHESHTL